jgi:protein-disulfide isomerase
MATRLKVPVTSNDHIQGDEAAPVTLMEYGDYQCRYCGAAYYIIKERQKSYGPQLRFAFRNFPLTEVHPFAEPAAEVAESAGSHRRFWRMHDRLYENQDSLGLPLFAELAEELDLPVEGLRQALIDHQFLPKIRADFLAGVRSGVNATPTFFINGVRHEGSYQLEDLTTSIDAHIAAQPRKAA